MKYEELLPRRMDTASATAVSPIANYDITDVFDTIAIGNFDLNFDITQKDSNVNMFD